MNRNLNLIILTILIFSPFPEKIYSQQNSQQEKRLALIIGNGNYVSGMPLANPENDAQAMKNVLQKAGFEVVEFENLSQSQMKKEIDDFGMRLKNYDVGLFFYAGHGIQSRGVNYLIPVDAQIKTEAQVEYDCVQADRVVALMEESGAKVKIIILDACRNNPFERSWTRSASGRGLAVMNAPSGTLIAYATSPGSTASDGGGKNGLYTSGILDNILKPEINILQIFQNVRAFVSQKSNKQQIPWESTSLVGDFYFSKTNEMPKDTMSVISKGSTLSSNFEIPSDGIMITSLMKKEVIRTNTGENLSDTLLFVTLNEGQNSKIRKYSYLKVYAPSFERSHLTGREESVKDKFVGTINVKSSFRDKSEGELNLNRSQDVNEFKYYQSYAKLKHTKQSLFLTSGITVIGNKNSQAGSFHQYINLGFKIDWIIGAYVGIGLARYEGEWYIYGANYSEHVKWILPSLKVGLSKSISPKFDIGGGVTFSRRSIDHSVYHDRYLAMHTIDILFSSHFKNRYFLIYGFSAEFEFSSFIIPFGVGYRF